MPKPLGQFFITDPFSTPSGWALKPGQISVNAVVYVNNQSPQEFDIYGNGVNYLGKAPAWISFWKFTMDLVYTFVEFRPTMSLNPLIEPALYVNGIVFESYENDPHWQPIAVVRQVDQARQQRNVAVPIGLDHWNGGLWAATDPDPLIIATPLMTAAQIAAQRMPVYLYYAQVTPATATVAAMSFWVQLQWLDASNTPLGGPVLFVPGIVANASVTSFIPWNFFPSWPVALVGPSQPNAAKAQLQIKFLAGTRISVLFNVGFWPDQFNTIGDAGIGTQAIYSAAFPNADPFF